METFHVQERPERRAKRLQGYVQRSMATVRSAYFEDVSDGGCCIAGDFKIGEWLVVMVPNIGTTSAQVRWAIGGRAGLRFE